MDHVPGCNPYMNIKHVHIGHAQIIQLFIIPAWAFLIYNCQRTSFRLNQQIQM